MEREHTTAITSRPAASATRPSAPFLLDLGYANMLETGAYRRRFATLNLHLFPQLAGFVVALLSLASMTVLPALFFLTGVKAYIVISGWCSSFAIHICGFCLVYWWPGGWLRYLRLRRLAWHGELCDGVILLARRVLVRGEDEDPDKIMVEIEYRAETPTGVRVQGTGRCQRDDLLNGELPATGTPVVVLLLNEKTHAVL